MGIGPIAARLKAARPGFETGEFTRNSTTPANKIALGVGCVKYASAFARLARSRDFPGQMIDFWQDKLFHSEFDGIRRTGH